MSDLSSVLFYGAKGIGFCEVSSSILEEKIIREKMNFSVHIKK